MEPPCANRTRHSSPPNTDASEPHCTRYKYMAEQHTPCSFPARFAVSCWDRGPSTTYFFDTVGSPLPGRALMAPKLRSVAAPGSDAPADAADAASPGTERPAGPAAGPADAEPVPRSRRARAVRARIESAAPDASADDADERSAAGTGPVHRIITDLRQNSIENLRVEHRRLKDATKQAQRDMRNAKRRRNRILSKIRNLDAESILSVLIDRGMPEERTPAELTAALPPRSPAPPTPAGSSTDPPVAAPASHADSDPDGTEAAPSIGEPEDASALDLDDLASAQPLESMCPAEPTSGSSTDPVIADLRAPSPTGADVPVVIGEDM